MTELDVATKAPESDATAPAPSTTTEQPIIPGDTPAQTGPTMGQHSEHCVSDRPTRKPKLGFSFDCHHLTLH